MQNSVVNIEREAQVTGTNGSIAIKIGNDSTDNSKPSCVTQKCVDSNARTTLINFPSFKTQSTNDNRTISNNQTLTLAQGTYKNINFGWRSKLHLTNNNQVTYIQHLNANQSQTEITFEEGIYWIDTLSIGFETKIKISDNDRVILFVNNANLSQSTPSFNQLGLPEQLVLVLYNSTTFGFRTVLNGFVYSLSSVFVQNESKITGAIHSNKTQLGYRSVLNYAQSSVTNLDIDSYCSSQGSVLPQPVVDFKFDRTYWTDAKNDVIDSSANKVHGSINDDVRVFETGKVCRAASFDGTDDYINAPGIENYLTDTATLVFWIKTSQKGHNTPWYAPGIIGIEEQGGVDDIFWGIIDESGRIGFQKGDGTQIKSSNPINDDRWHHVVFSWNAQNGEAKVYINGVLNQTGTTDAGKVTTNFSHIGKIVDSFNSTQFIGKLDELSVYDQILTENDIKSIYDQQSVGKNSDGSGRVCPIEAQAGQVTLYDTSKIPRFTQVCFEREFSITPKIFTLGQTNDDDRLVLRIKNVTTQGFEIAQVESEERAASANEKPAGNVSQTIDFLAIVEGDHNLEDGKSLRVATHNTTTKQGRLASGQSAWDDISISDMELDEKPAVIANIQTLNNETDPFPYSEPFLTAIVDDLRENYFRIALERGETEKGDVANTESIAYLVTNSDNTSQINRDIKIESFLLDNAINGINGDRCNSYSFQNNFANTPLVIASQNSRNGGDGGWVARCSLSATGVGFTVLEDRDNDADTGHVLEDVSGLALSGNFSNQACGVVFEDIHHYRIEHDGHGLTCDPESVTIKACLDENCNNVSSRETNVELTLGGESKSVSTFIGETVVPFEHTSAETASLDIVNPTVVSLNPVICHTGSNSSCDITFKNAGFRFLDASNNTPVINNQIAGVVFPEGIKIQAVEDESGVCKGIFNSDQTVEFAQENVNPSGSSGLSFEINGNSISKYSNNNTTSISLEFDDESSALLPNTLYKDAGQIRLRAFYNNYNIQLEGASRAFWVKPAKFIVNATKSGVALNGNSANSAITHAAGEDFELSIQAVNAANPAQVTVNYQPEQLQFSLARLLPNISGSVDGSLIYANGQAVNSHITPIFQNANISTFSSGIYTYNNAQFSEIGVLELSIRDNNYGNTGLMIASDPITIGRFTPAYLTQQVVDSGSLYATCDSRMAFTAYSGQKLETNDSVGAISYLSNPVISITAYNAQGVITKNYHQDTQGSINDFMKLESEHINMKSPTHDLVAKGVDGSLLPIVASMEAGTLSQTDLTSSGSQPLARGMLHYRLSGNDHFYYTRTSNSLVDPFSARIQFELANSVDSDNVAIKNLQPFTPTGIQIRFGRTYLENIFGPETHNLAIDMFLQHYEDGRFIKSSDNSCPSVYLNRFTLGSLSLDANLTEVIGGSNHFLNGATKGIYLKAPGENNTGNISISYDSFEWLKYDWAITGTMDQNPSAEATFGIYKGDQRLLHWREIY